jgi:hypothetical protein
LRLRCSSVSRLSGWRSSHEVMSRTLGGGGVAGGGPNWRKGRR